VIKMKTGLAGILERAGQVTRLVRPAPAAAPPPYVKCAGCGKGGRGDQQVPDPDQFVKVKGETPGTEKAEGDIKLIDAAPVRCSCGRWYHAIRCYSLHHHD
jgi:hypothetical protein